MSVLHEKLSYSSLIRYFFFANLILASTFKIHSQSSTKRERLNTFFLPFPYSFSTILFLLLVEHPDSLLSEDFVFSPTSLLESLFDFFLPRRSFELAFVYFSTPVSRSIVETPGCLLTNKEKMFGLGILKSFREKTFHSVGKKNT